MHDRAIPLRRLLALRQFPVFSALELGELAMIAENVRELVLPAGTRIDSDNGLAGVHLVLDGSLGGIGPRETFGLLEVLASRMPPAAVTELKTRTFQLGGDELGEVLEDNFGLLRALLGDLATRLVAAGGLRPARMRTRPPEGPLTLVERLIVLRQHMPFDDGPLQAMATLAHAAEELAWPAGFVAARAGEPAESAIVILDGTLQAGARTIGPGEAIGALEMLARMRHPSEIVTVTPVRALRCSAAAILDVIEDHTELGVAMLAAFARQLLDRAN
jgi:CRP-like cAMP-binding protein